MSNRRCTYPEERAPCGAPGLAWHYWPWVHDDEPAPPLDDLLVNRPAPGRLVIWEPLQTKAPAPPKVQPHCCYIRTVIFYHYPNIPQVGGRPWIRHGRLMRDRAGRGHFLRGGHLAWDQIETRLSWDALLRFQGVVFRVTGGHVLWRQRAWWMCRYAGLVYRIEGTA